MEYSFVELQSEQSSKGKMQLNSRIVMRQAFGENESCQCSLVHQSWS